MAYKSYKNSVSNTFKANISRALGKMAIAGIISIDTETPIDTGELIKGNRFRQFGHEKVIFYNITPYAAFVEFGTYKQNENPYFRRGILGSFGLWASIWYRELKI